MYPGIIRAWHHHLRGQINYFMVVRGVAKIFIYNEESGELNEIVSASGNLQVICVPSHYWHGFKALGV